MNLDAQMLINALGAVLCIFLGYFLRDLSEKLKDMKAESLAQGKCIAEIKLLVTGQYVKKEEHSDSLQRQKDDTEKLINALFKKLDSIAEKVDDVRHGTLQQITEIKLNCASNGHPVKG